MLVGGQLADVPVVATAKRLGRYVLVNRCHSYGMSCGDDDASRMVALDAVNTRRLNDPELPDGCPNCFEPFGMAEVLGGDMPTGVGRGYFDVMCMTGCDRVLQ